LNNSSQTRLGGQRRGYSPRDGRLKHHDVSRHYYEEDGCYDGSGNPIGRADATQFPPYVNPGDITRLRDEVTKEWYKYCRGLPSGITDEQKAGRGAMRVAVDVGGGIWP